MSKLPEPRLSHTWRGTGAWNNPKQFRCGHCGRDTGSDQGYQLDSGHGVDVVSVRICPQCNRPSYFEKDWQTPGAPLGSPVAHLPTDVEALYEEARRCTAADAYTAAVLACRKILMHVAVSQGADENKNFQYYVNYLRDQHWVPPNAAPWVDHIRTKGNLANHEIVVMSATDAADLLRFTEYLLRFVYELPNAAPGGSPPPAGAASL